MSFLKVLHSKIMYFSIKKPMEVILLILGLLCCIVGIIGSVLPVLPGPPISWLGLLFIYLIEGIAINYWLLGITLVVAIAIFILDYTIPAMGTKRFGGSKYGAWGTTIGLIVGLIAPIPLGFIIGPFVGAFVGEVLFNRSSSKNALRAAVGSFLGFLASTFMKVFVAFGYLVIFIYIAYTNWSVIF